jgi:hypothetical protein
MADQRVEAAGRGRGLSRAVTNVFAPQHVAMAMPPAVGLLAESWSGLVWGMLAAALCVGVPMTVILVGVRRGRLDSIHLVDRRSRKGPMLAGFASVAAGLTVLVLLDAPRMAVAAAAVMLAWVLVMGPITLRWKISFHAGVSAGTVVLLAHVLPVLPVVVVGAVMVAVICWARVRVSHHTPAQALAGVAAGATSAWATLAVLL